MEELDIYVHGIIQCVICTNIDESNVEEITNQKNPTGISSKWKISKILGPCENRVGFTLYLMEC